MRAAEATIEKERQTAGSTTLRNTETTARPDAEIKRRAVYVQRNVEAPSCNHCFSGKRIGITYSECVSAALSI